MDMFFGWDHFDISLQHFCGILQQIFVSFHSLTMEYFSLGVGCGPERTEYSVGNVQNCSPQIL